MLKRDKNFCLRFNRRFFHRRNSGFRNVEWRSGDGYGGRKRLEGEEDEVKDAIEEEEREKSG